MTALSEFSGWHAGALIRDENGEPTWRYRLEPFRRAVAESGVPSQVIELRCGWVRAEQDHSGYLSRVLGERPAAGTTRYLPDGTTKLYKGKLASSLSYDNAVRIARALDLDFVEWEL